MCRPRQGSGHAIFGRATMGTDVVPSLRPRDQDQSPPSRDPLGQARLSKQAGLPGLWPSLPGILLSAEPIGASLGKGPWTNRTRLTRDLTHLTLWR